MNVIGALSGTSLDGLDIGWVRMEDDYPRLVHSVTLPWPDALRWQWQQSLRAEALTSAHLARLDRLTALAFAEAIVQQLREWSLPAAEISAIGFHGQTLAHGGDDQPAWSLQLGHAPTLAAETGIPVVAGFRQDDIANGGQGAPLAPLLHRQLLGEVEETAAVLNIGGIANLSLLMPEQTLGLDTGPGNALLDDWYRKHHPRDPAGFDRGGRWARSGQVLPKLLQHLLADPWFEQPPPRSACRSDFSLHWLDGHLLEALEGGEKPADIQATLVALSAESIARSLQSLAPDCRRMWVAGGGAHNHALMQALEQALPEVAIQPARLAGLDVDGLEAQLFAWLAACRLKETELDLRGVTGARCPRLLGQVYLPPGCRPG